MLPTRSAKADLCSSAETSIYIAVDCCRIIATSGIVVVIIVIIVIIISSGFTALLIIVLTYFVQGFAPIH